jgi:hypothetical protein
MEEAMLTCRELLGCLQRSPANFVISSGFGSDRAEHMMSLALEFRDQGGTDQT